MSGDHLDASCWDEPGYVESKLAVLEKYNLKVWAISNHLKGQAVCDDPIDFRHEAIVSSKAWGDGTPEGDRRRGLLAARLISAVQRSAREGGRQDVPRSTRN
ncbi:hypothetical protein ACVWY0_002298 [Arthrobacter sp. UYNi723]